jgi:ligand-binding sensor domain-containing protein
MIPIRKSIFLALGAFFPILSFAATPSMRIYSAADGLARNDINRIVTDSRGFLWFCTEEGLSRFDGLSFRNYGTQDGLPDSDVLDIVETEDGFWVATARGLARFDPDAAVRHLPLFTSYHPATGDKSSPIVKLLADVEWTLAFVRNAQGAVQV